MHHAAASFGALVRLETPDPSVIQPLSKSVFAGYFGEVCRKNCFDKLVQGGQPDMRYRFSRHAGKNRVQWVRIGTKKNPGLDGPGFRLQ